MQESLGPDNSELQDAEFQPVVEYLHSFRSSPIYKEELAGYVSSPFRRGVKAEYADPYTRDRVVGRFENSDKGPDTLLKYAEKSPLIVDKDTLPQEFSARLSSYNDKVLAMANGKRNDADRIKDLDIERSSIHSSLANMLLASGVCSSHSLARVLVSLIHNSNYPGSTDIRSLKNNLRRRKFSIGS